VAIAGTGHLSGVRTVVAHLSVFVSVRRLGKWLYLLHVRQRVWPRLKRTNFILQGLPFLSQAPLETSGLRSSLRRLLFSCVIGSRKCPSAILICFKGGNAEKILSQLYLDNT
jgi:hypothetical protein